MEYIKILKQGLIITAATSLIACGGGGGSSSSSDDITYSGSTGSAKITADNIDELLGASFGSSDSASASSSANATSSDTNTETGRNRAIGFGRSLTRATSSATVNHKNSGSSSNAVLVNEDTTEVGECGGEAVTTGTWDDEVFDVDLTVTFNNYCVGAATVEEGDTINGVVTIKGERYADKSFDWKVTFSKLNFKNKTDNMTMNGSTAAVGTMFADNSEEVETFSIVMNYDFKDHNANKIYRVENYGINVTVDVSRDYVTGIISGRIYHPDYGYYTISTNPELVIYEIYDYPTSGTVTISGAEGSYASASFHENGTYTLTIDDGATRTVKTCDSVTDVCTPAPQ